MQIGEFAKICNTKISVLRHYDKEGLLSPDFTDPFTGYRYYSKDQVGDFLKISLLKRAGFSLSEIREIMINKNASEDIPELFEKKKEELRETLIRFDEAKKLLLGMQDEKHVSIEKDDSGSFAKCSRLSPDEWNTACEAIENTLAKEGYQRTSVYRMEADTEGSGLKVSCRAVKLLDTLNALHESVALPFVNDERVIGKWEAMGEFALKEDFYSGVFPSDHSLSKKRIMKTVYFLPEGKEYWCYSWTRGKLIIKRGGGDSSVNDYTLETRNGETYMFVDLKSYNFRRGGVTTTLVLRKLDSIPYKIEDIARKDDIDIPFIDDPKVKGAWRACGFCEEIDDFTPDTKQIGNWFLNTIEFFEGGLIRLVFSTGQVIENKDAECWTKGYHIRKWMSTKSAYTIKTMDEKDYLFLQWKSGDYIYGGFDPMYYVFERT